ncbi:hypothetical protein T4C_5819 [Trichinella pseudospiralis]|uniref:Uncharacterized protein n=1 Tax=Trichinella pseudospiralis TaxID=6337 RepID=A0A0V1GGG2_TRIPS|nr:hypothetical protein T4C_5819 [Trichinella pseudospiralis]
MALLMKIVAKTETGLKQCFFIKIKKNKCSSV